MKPNAINCAALKAPAVHMDRQSRIIAPQINGQMPEVKNSVTSKPGKFFVHASNGRVVVTKSR